METALKVNGLVQTELNLSIEDFQNVTDAYQVVDITTLMPGREGQAITLEGLLALCQPSTPILSIRIPI